MRKLIFLLNMASLLLLLQTFSCFGNPEINEEELNSIISSIWQDPRLFYWDDLTYAGRQNALYSVIYNNKTLRKLFTDEYAALWPLNDDPPPKFSCVPQLYANCTATSIHRLTPSDISVIGALGDSISAGTGALAKTIIGILNQYRGHVFSVGGAETVETNPTLPNILRQYNRHLTGYATGKGNADSKNAHLDLAVPGANSKDLLEQTRRLIDRMRIDPMVDFEYDWKLVNIFMGNNDICDFCDEAPDVLTAKNYGLRIQETLDLLHKEMPRTFVNLITIMDVAEVTQLNIGVVCNLVHAFVCRCAAFPKDRNKIVKMNNDFQSEIRKVIANGRYDTRDDFTVVVQPFFQNTLIPKIPNSDKIDLSYFAPDCFHFSVKGHWQAALSLWNSMFEPVGKKRVFWVPGEDYECPTKQNPYLATSKNSQSIV